MLASLERPPDASVLSRVACTCNRVGHVAVGHAGLQTLACCIPPCWMCQQWAMRGDGMMRATLLLTHQWAMCGATSRLALATLLPMRQWADVTTGCQCLTHPTALVSYVQPDWSRNSGL